MKSLSQVSNCKLLKVLEVIFITRNGGYAIKTSVKTTDDIVRVLRKINF